MELRNSDLRIPVALGRDVRGNPVIGDLSAMPHVFVVGKRLRLPLLLSDRVRAVFLNSATVAFASPNSRASAGVSQIVHPTS